MKKSIIFYACLILGSCAGGSSDSAPEGIYTCVHEHEFAKTEDTFMLKKINENNFEIIRHAGVIKKVNDTVLPKELLTETWKLEYDNNKKTFTERKTGKLLIWDPGKQALIFGNKEYVKK